MEKQQRILIFDSVREMSEFTMKRWEEISKTAIEKCGSFTVALSGGKTPIDFYRKLADSQGVSRWEKTHIFLVDERFLPFSDPDSNYGLLTNIFLKSEQIPKENFHPVPTEGPTLESSARQYEEDLRRFFRLTRGGLPHFDLILLGIGEDGHTASLFPHSPVLDDTIHLAAPVLLDEARHHRITLTLPVINNGGNVMFLVSGKNKAAILEKVIKDKDPSLPASHVKPRNGKLVFLIDLEASSRLSLSIDDSPPIH
jgi:6-phosphogluconolactonase